PAAYPAGPVDREEGRAARPRRHRGGDRARDRRVEVRRRRAGDADDDDAPAPRRAAEGAAVRGRPQGHVPRDPPHFGDRPRRLPGNASSRRRRVPRGPAVLAERQASGRRALQAARQAAVAAGTPQPQGRRHAHENRPRSRLRRPRAVIVVTGTELVRGDRTDLNGPFLAREAERLGLEVARIDIVGDSAEELERVLRAALADGEAVLTSGGLGPTHDDRTVELVAAALGVGLHVDPQLEAQIEEISRAAAERLRRNYADFAAGVTKQATIPDGAESV